MALFMPSSIFYKISTEKNNWNSSWGSFQWDLTHTLLEIN